MTLWQLNKLKIKLTFGDGDMYGEEDFIWTVVSTSDIPSNDYTHSAALLPNKS
jgi:hypothetical protein